MIRVALHYKDASGVVIDTVVRVLPDHDVARYVRHYGCSDRVVVRTRQATPGDLRRDRTRAACVTHLRSA